jgi:hypothetical protein
MSSRILLESKQYKIIAIWYGQSRIAFVSSIDLLIILSCSLRFKGYMHMFLQRNFPSLLINCICKYQGHSPL